MIALSSFSALPCANQLLHTLGRVRSLRSHGQLSFVDIIHNGSSLQLAFEATACLIPQELMVGSWIEVQGLYRPSLRGEPTLWINHCQVHNSPTQPLEQQPPQANAPEQRFLLEPTLIPLARRRSSLIRGLRETLWSEEFHEVETPVLHTSATGASARPFVTHARAIDQSMFLRVAPEAHLIRLMSAGFDRIFEVARSFRNEGLSNRHQPEFSLLEVYQAGATMEQSMNHVVRLIVGALTHAGIDPACAVFGEHTLDWTNARVVSLSDLVQEHTGCVTSSDCMTWLQARGLAVPVEQNEMHLVVFEHAIEQTIVQPTFVHSYPVSTSPLARQVGEVARRFELFAGGMELANGFEQNICPIVQRERFLQQALRQGCEDVMQTDEDYLFAMQWGLPPIGGFGIGIDRLVMLGLNHPCIRDALLFPM